MTGNRWKVAAATVGAMALAAGMSAAQASSLDRAYIGAQMGWSMYDMELHDRGADIKLEGASASGVSGGMFGGAGVVNRNGIYGGFEVHYSVEGADGSFSTPDAEAILDMDESFGLTLHAGPVYKDDTLFYGLLGYRWLEAEGTYTTATGVSRDDDRIGGVRFGFGVRHQVDERFFLRAEYGYTVFSSETLRFDGERVAIDPESSEFHFGLGYRF